MLRYLFFQSLNVLFFANVGGAAYMVVYGGRSSPSCAMGDTWALHLASSRWARLEPTATVRPPPWQRTQ